MNIYVYAYISINQQSVKKEAMDLNESREGHLGRFGRFGGRKRGKCS